MTTYRSLISSRPFLMDLLALLAGIGLTFAFAPYYLFPLAAIMPAFLLAIWLHSSVKRAAWRGFLFGLGLFGAGVYWVYISIHTMGNLPASLSLVITASFIVILALFPASVGFILNRYFPYPTPSKIMFAFPAIWVLVEWVRSWIFTGFPWLFLGYSQTISPLKGYAPLLSVYGVSLAILLTSAALYNSYTAIKQKKRTLLCKNLFVIALIWIIGAACSYIPWTQNQSRDLTVALVQGNIPQNIKWLPEHVGLSLQRYQELTKPLWGKDRLIIWPEAAVPIPLQDIHPYIQELNNDALQHQASLMLGIPIQTKDGYYNALITLGKEKNSYLKRHLVPFGEYTPFEKMFNKAFSFMNIPMSEMVPGQYVQQPLVVDGIKILPAICYEIAYPELMLTSDRDIGFLLTITNDAWFGKSNAQAQHLQMAAMRAIELQRPLVFVSNDGITAFLSPAGRIERAAPAHQVFVLEGRIQPRVGLTPWMRNGPDPLLFILICFFFGALRIQIVQKRIHLQSSTSN